MMSRIRIELPQAFHFSTTIAVRITDLNYGGHVGNDTILSLIHEARMQFLKKAGYTELEFEGAGLIMTDVAIEFKAELFYGDMITAEVVAGNFTRSGFHLYYRISKQPSTVVATAQTGMLCYDYAKKKIVMLAEKAANYLKEIK